MKRICKGVVIGTVLAALLFASVGCTKKEEAKAVSEGAGKGAAAKSAEPVKLTVWINGRDSYIGPDEQKKAQEEWYISKAFRRFEAANPGVTIELIVPPDSSEAHQTFKAAGLAGNAPDIANLWSGQFIFALKEVIRPLDDLVPPDDLKNMIGWDTVREDFKADGKILGYPVGDVQLCFFLYNKKIVKQAGLDFEANPPRNPKDFDAAMEKLKKQGVVPIITDESFPWFYLYLGAYWWYQMSGLERIMQNCYGETKFVDDKGYMDSLAYYNALYKKGFVNKDALTSADSWNKFLQGKAAMMPQVSSVINDAIAALGAENVGIMLPPDLIPDGKVQNSTIGGPGQCLVVSKNSKHPDVAVKLLSFLSSKAEVLEFQKVQSKVPVRTDVTAQELGWKEGSIPIKLQEWSKRYIYFIANCLTPNVVDDFYKLTPLTLTGKMTPRQLGEELDKKVAKTKQ